MARLPLCLCGLPVGCLWAVLFATLRSLCRALFGTDLPRGKTRKNPYFTAANPETVLFSGCFLIVF